MNEEVKQNSFVSDAVNEEQPLLEIKNLKQYFSIHTGFMKNTDLKAVDDVSFVIKKGETLGLVGESGCGKTTVGRSILHLYKPTAGEIIFKGKLISDKESIMAFRKKASMVFQDPYSSLNPRMTVGDIIGEPLDVHQLYATKEERKERIHELMSLVGLSSEHSTRYVHEFSGGQRQRIGIARALAVNPEFIVCDEPVSALDVSIQAQVINMFEDLQKKLHLTYLFIAHDLHIVEHISNRIAVMYLGKIVEIADSGELVNHFLHPYTESLLSAVPIADPIQARKRRRIILQGDVPSPLRVPSGCSFRTRCPRATALCAEQTPELKEIKANHFVACHHIIEDKQ
ncbi:MAG: ABC transporter ATP-binding protein [Bacilli bacterium]